MDPQASEHVVIPATQAANLQEDAQQPQLPDLEPQLDPIPTRLSKATFQAGYRAAVVREGELLAAIESLRELLADSQHFSQGIADELTAASREHATTEAQHRRELQQAKDAVLSASRQNIGLRHASSIAARVLEQVVRNLNWILTDWQVDNGDGEYGAHVILQFDDWHISVETGEANIWCEGVTLPQLARVGANGLTGSGLTILFGCIRLAGMTADERARLSPELRAQVFVEPSKPTISVPMGRPTSIPHGMSG